MITFPTTIMGSVGKPAVYPAIGLIGYCDCGQASNPLDDLTGNGNFSGFSPGLPVQQPGVDGNFCVEFSYAAARQVDFWLEAGGTGIDTTGDFTHTFWWFSTTGGGTYAWSYGGNTYNLNLIISPNRWQFGWTGAGGSSNFTTSALPGYSHSTWFFAAIQRSGTDTTVYHGAYNAGGGNSLTKFTGSLAGNGVPNGSDANGYRWGFAVNRDSANVGTGSRIDEVAWWNSVKTEVEINYIFNSGAGRFYDWGGFCIKQG